MSRRPHLAKVPSEEVAVELDSGRVVSVNEEAEVVEIRSPEGELELRVELTEAGPVLRMSAVRMELSAQEAVSVSAPKIDLQSKEGTQIQSDGDVRVEGAMIWLN